MHAALIATDVARNAEIDGAAVLRGAVTSATEDTARMTMSLTHAEAEIVRLQVGLRGCGWVCG